MEKLLEEIGQRAYDSWKGQMGEERRKSVLDLLAKKLPHYSEKLGIPQEQILQAWEKAKNVNTVNWYQEENFPDLDEVIVLDTLAQFKEKFPSHKSICPCCNGESTDYYECNSGKAIDKKGKICDWKVYGLFGDMGKGVKVFVKNKFLESPKPTTIFKPIELLNT